MISIAEELKRTLESFNDFDVCLVSAWSCRHASLLFLQCMRFSSSLSSWCCTSVIWVFMLWYC